MKQSQLIPVRFARQRRGRSRHLLLPVLVSRVATLIVAERRHPVLVRIISILEVVDLGIVPLAAGGRPHINFMERLRLVEFVPVLSALLVGVQVGSCLIPLAILQLCVVVVAGSVSAGSTSKQKCSSASRRTWT